MSLRQEYHFYKSDGTPCHGTLDAAAKVGAFPSVTTALSLIYKEFVERWKIREAIQTALQLTRKERETVKEFADRCIRHNDIKGKITTDFGTRVHKGVEIFHDQHTAWRTDGLAHAPTAKTASAHDPDILLWLEQYEDWFYKNVKAVLHSETCSVSKRYGYAGQIDCVALLLTGKLALLDFKTQKLKEKQAYKSHLPKTFAHETEDAVIYWPASFYETWLLQLAAYQASLLEEKNIKTEELVSVAINSQAPTPIESKIWSPKEHAPAFQGFLSTLQLWKWLNNYHPKTA